MVEILVQESPCSSMDKARVRIIWRRGMCRIVRAKLSRKWRRYRKVRWSVKQEGVILALGIMHFRSEKIFIEASRQIVNINALQAKYSTMVSRGEPLAILTPPQIPCKWLARIVRARKISRKSRFSTISLQQAATIRPPSQSMQEISTFLQHMEVVSNSCQESELQSRSSCLNLPSVWRTKKVRHKGYLVVFQETKEFKEPMGLQEVWGATQIW